MLLQAEPVSSLRLDSGIGQLSSADLSARQASVSSTLQAAEPGSMLEVPLSLSFSSHCLANPGRRKDHPLFATLSTAWLSPQLIFTELK